MTIMFLILKENTFQLVLISSGCNLFAIFNYGTIEWSVPASRLVHPFI